MKDFLKLVKKTQREMKDYLVKFLKSQGYKPIVGDGYVCGVGTLPVCLVSHMDTVYNTVPKDIKLESYNGMKKIWSPQGIGGDDRCGIWIIRKLILNGKKPTVLFLEDEERGCVGAKKFVNSKDFNSFPDVHYLIELDRKGNNDSVYYSCDNKEFIEWIEKETGYIKALGSCSDISTLMPALNVSGVNFSVGYYNEHQKEKEYVLWDEVENTYSMVNDLLELESKEYEYVAKQYTSYWGNWSSSSYGSKGWYDDYDEKFNSSSYYSYNKTTKSKTYDTKIKLVATLDESYYGEEYEVESEGDTKPEAWMKLFMDNPSLAFEMITDYYYE